MQKAKRLLSFLLVLALLCRDLALAYPAGGNQGLFSEVPAREIHIPKALGHVVSTHERDLDAKAKLFVFHIQTVHAQPETARTTAKIIRYLKRHYDADLVLAEGAAGTLHPEFLNLVSRPSENQRLLEALTDKGLLTGVDLALNHDGIQGSGIEDPELYRAAYQELKAVFLKKNENGQVLESMRGRLDQRAAGIFSRELREVMTLWGGFQSGQRPAATVFEELRKSALKILKINLQSPFAQFDWPQLTRMAMLNEAEKHFLDVKLKQEVKTLWQWSQSQGMNNAAAMLAVIQLESSETKQRGLQSPRRRVEAFLSEALPKGFSFKNYPQVLYALLARTVESELDAQDLFREAERLFEKLQDESAKTAAQKSLLREYRDQALLEKLIRLELTPAEWETAKQKLGAFQKLSAAAPTGFQTALLRAWRFYVLMESRDLAFFELIQKTLRKRTRPVILVTGGFHTPGLQKLFDENNISRALISPRIHGDIDSGLYTQVMLGTEHMERGLFTGSAAALNAMDWPFREEVNNVVETARNLGLPPLERSAPYFADRRHAGRSEVRTSPQPPDLFENLKQFVKNGNVITQRDRDQIASALAAFSGDGQSFVETNPIWQGDRRHLEVWQEILRRHYAKQEIMLKAQTYTPDVSRELTAELQKKISHIPEDMARELILRLRYERIQREPVGGTMMYPSSILNLDPAQAYLKDSVLSNGRQLSHLFFANPSTEMQGVTVFTEFFLLDGQLIGHGGSSTPVKKLSMVSFGLYPEHRKQKNLASELYRNRLATLRVLMGKDTMFLVPTVQIQPDKQTGSRPIAFYLRLGFIPAKPDEELQQLAFILTKKLQTNSPADLVSSDLLDEFVQQLDGTPGLVLLRSEVRQRPNTTVVMGRIKKIAASFLAQPPELEERRIALQQQFERDVEALRNTGKGPFLAELLKDIKRDPHETLDGYNSWVTLLQSAISEAEQIRTERTFRGLELQPAQTLRITGLSLDSENSMLNIRVNRIWYFDGKPRHVEFTVESPSRQWIVTERQEWIGGGYFQNSDGSLKTDSLAAEIAKFGGEAGMSRTFKRRGGVRFAVYDTKTGNEFVFGIKKISGNSAEFEIEEAELGPGARLEVIQPFQSSKEENYGSRPSITQVNARLTKYLRRYVDGDSFKNPRELMALIKDEIATLVSARADYLLATQLKLVRSRAQDDQDSPWAEWVEPFEQAVQAAQAQLETQRISRRNFGVLPGEMVEITGLQLDSSNTPLQITLHEIRNGSAQVTVAAPGSEELIITLASAWARGEYMDRDGEFHRRNLSELQEEFLNSDYQRRESLDFRKGTALVAFNIVTHAEFVFIIGPSNRDEGAVLTVEKRYLQQGQFRPQFGRNSKSGQKGNVGGLDRRQTTLSASRLYARLRAFSDNPENELASGIQADITRLAEAGKTGFLKTLHQTVHESQDPFIAQWAEAVFTAIGLSEKREGRLEYETVTLTNQQTLRIAGLQLDPEDSHFDLVLKNEPRPAGSSAVLELRDATHQLILSPTGDWIPEMIRQRSRFVTDTGDVNELALGDELQSQTVGGHSPSILLEGDKALPYTIVVAHAPIRREFNFEVLAATTDSVTLRISKDELGKTGTISVVATALAPATGNNVAAVAAASSGESAGTIDRTVLSASPAVPRPEFVWVKSPFALELEAFLNLARQPNIAAETLMRKGANLFGYILDKKSQEALQDEEKNAIEITKRSMMQAWQAYDEVAEGRIETRAAVPAIVACFAVLYRALIGYKLDAMDLPPPSLDTASLDFQRGHLQRWMRMSEREAGFTPFFSLKNAGVENLGGAEIFSVQHLLAARHAGFRGEHAGQVFTDLFDGAESYLQSHPENAFFFEFANPLISVRIMPARGIQPPYLMLEFSLPPPGYDSRFVRLFVLHKPLLDIGVLEHPGAEFLREYFAGSAEDLQAYAMTPQTASEERRNITGRLRALAAGERVLAQDNYNPGFRPEDRRRYEQFVSRDDSGRQGPSENEAIETAFNFDKAFAEQKIKNFSFTQALGWGSTSREEDSDSEDVSNARRVRLNRLHGLRENKEYASLAEIVSSGGLLTPLVALALALDPRTDQSELIIPLTGKLPAPSADGKSVAPNLIWANHEHHTLEFLKILKELAAKAKIWGLEDKVEKAAEAYAASAQDSSVKNELKTIFKLEVLYRIFYETFHTKQIFTPDRRPPFWFTLAGVAKNLWGQPVSSSRVWHLMRQYLGADERAVQKKLAEENVQGYWLAGREKNSLPDLALSISADVNEAALMTSSAVPGLLEIDEKKFKDPWILTRVKDAKGLEENLAKFSEHLKNFEMEQDIQIKRESTRSLTAFYADVYAIRIHYEAGRFDEALEIIAKYLRSAGGAVRDAPFPNVSWIKPFQQMQADIRKAKKSDSAEPKPVQAGKNVSTFAAAVSRLETSAEQTPSGENPQSGEAATPATPPDALPSAELPPPGIAPETLSGLLRDHHQLLMRGELPQDSAALATIDAVSDSWAFYGGAPVFSFFQIQQNDRPANYLFPLVPSAREVDNLEAQKVGRYRAVYKQRQKDNLRQGTAAVGDLEKKIRILKTRLNGSRDYEVLTTADFSPSAEAAASLLTSAVEGRATSLERMQRAREENGTAAEALMESIRQMIADRYSVLETLENLEREFEGKMDRHGQVAHATAVALWEAYRLRVKAWPRIAATVTANILSLGDGSLKALISRQVIHQMSRNIQSSMLDPHQHIFPGEVPVEFLSRYYYDAIRVVLLESVSALQADLARADFSPRKWYVSWALLTAPWIVMAEVERGITQYIQNNATALTSPKVSFYPLWIGGALYLDEHQRPQAWVPGVGSTIEMGDMFPRVNARAVQTHFDAAKHRSIALTYPALSGFPNQNLVTLYWDDRRRILQLVPEVEEVLLATFDQEGRLRFFRPKTRSLDDADHANAFAEATSNLERLFGPVYEMSQFFAQGGWSLVERKKWEDSRKDYRRALQRIIENKFGPETAQLAVDVLLGLFGDKFKAVSREKEGNTGKILEHFRSFIMPLGVLLAEYLCWKFYAFETYFDPVTIPGFSDPWPVLEKDDKKPAEKGNREKALSLVDQALKKKGREQFLNAEGQPATREDLTAFAVVWSETAKNFAFPRFKDAWLAHISEQIAVQQTLQTLTGQAADSAEAVKVLTASGKLSSDLWPDLAEARRAYASRSAEAAAVRIAAELAPASGIFNDLTTRLTQAREQFDTIRNFLQEFDRAGTVPDTSARISEVESQIKKLQSFNQSLQALQLPLPDLTAGEAAQKLFGLAEFSASAQAFLAGLQALTGQFPGQEEALVPLLAQAERLALPAVQFLSGVAAVAEDQTEVLSRIQSEMVPLQEGLHTLGILSEPLRVGLEELKGCLQHTLMIENDLLTTRQSLLEADYDAGLAVTGRYLDSAGTRHDGLILSARQETAFRDLQSELKKIQEREVFQEDMFRTQRIPQWRQSVKALQQVITQAMKLPFSEWTSKVNGMAADLTKITSAVNASGVPKRIKLEFGSELEEIQASVSGFKSAAESFGALALIPEQDIAAMAFMPLTENFKAVQQAVRSARQTVPDRSNYQARLDQEWSRYGTKVLTALLEQARTGIRQIPRADLEQQLASIRLTLEAMVNETQADTSVVESVLQIRDFLPAVRMLERIVKNTAHQTQAAKNSEYLFKIIAEKNPDARLFENVYDFSSQEISELDHEPDASARRDLLLKLFGTVLNAVNTKEVDWAAALTLRDDAVEIQTNFDDAEESLREVLGIKLMNIMMESIQPVSDVQEGFQQIKTGMPLVRETLRKFPADAAGIESESAQTLADHLWSEHHQVYASPGEKIVFSFDENAKIEIGVTLDGDHAVLNATVPAGFVGFTTAAAAFVADHNLRGGGGQWIEPLKRDVQRFRPVRGAETVTASLRVPVTAKTKRPELVFHTNMVPVADQQVPLLRTAETMDHQSDNSMTALETFLSLAPLTLRPLRKIQEGEHEILVMTVAGPWADEAKLSITPVVRSELRQVKTMPRRVEADLKDESTQAFGNIFSGRPLVALAEIWAGRRGRGLAIGFVAAKYLGTADPLWTRPVRAAFRGYLTQVVRESLYRTSDSEAIAASLQALSDPALDGLKMNPIQKQQSQDHPVLVQVMPDVLEAADQESLMARFSGLPAGSVVIGYTNSLKPVALDLGGLVPYGVGYQRQQFMRKISASQILSDRGTLLKKYPQLAGHEVFIFSKNSQFDQDLSEGHLGFVVRLDPARLKKQPRGYHSRLISSAAGEALEFAKLDQEVRDHLIRSGYFEFSQGVYSLNFDLMLDTRRNALVSSSA